MAKAVEDIVNGMLNSSESSLEFLDGLLLPLGFDLLELDLALGASLEAADQLLQILILVEVGPEGSSQVVEFSLVLLSDLGQGDHGCVFLVHQFAESSFALDEAVGDI